MNLNKVLNFCLRNIDKLTNKQTGNIYVYFFNFLNFLFFKTQKIYFEKNSYYLKPNNLSEKSWKFNQPKMGTMAYRDGLNGRKEMMRKVYLLENIKFELNDTIIDCGANNGDFYLCFNDSINYIGIEPSPSVFENLNHNISNQKLINKAVWKETKEKHEFFLSDDFGDSSMVKIKNYEKIINVKTCTLDDIISDLKKIKLIKIEAEGCEFEALLGLKDNIDKVEYIVIDVGFERGIDQQSTLKECTNLLLQNNFEIIAFRLERLVFLYKNTSFH